ncbi:hypothetical protein HZA97_00140 [Candidatus Woesearchaeota archaeon]|nr:hypothetical protein [Candidatus Woesearchaeota archaeon]
MNLKTLVLCAALSLSSGCATIANVIVGPGVAAVEAHKECFPVFRKILVESEKPQEKLLIVPMIIIYPIYLGINTLGGLPVGLTNGLGADIYRFKKGKYPDNYSLWDLGSGEEAFDKMRREDE